MTDLVPSGGTPIDRRALERIIQRAAELQASEREIGDSLTEEQVLALGREVGLPARHLQQAILEERTRVTRLSGSRWVTRFVGPARVVAQRTVPGEEHDVERALGHWMVEQELLVVKRRYPRQTSWEARSDLFASVRRGLGLGGRKYELSRAREIVGQVTQLEPGWCHVTLAADLTNTRNAHVGGGLFFLGSGIGGAAIVSVLGVFWPVALAPAVAGAVIGAAIARSRLSDTERVSVALEQVLDRLEHGEIRAPTPLPPPPRGTLSKALREEIRKHLGP